MKKTMQEFIGESRKRFTSENLKKIVPSLLLLGALLAVGVSVFGQFEDYLTTSSGIVFQSENWGVGFGAEGTQPSRNASATELKHYDAYYVGDADEKVIYLTFD